MKYKIVLVKKKELFEVDGQIIDIDGVKCGVHYDEECVSFLPYPTWIVTELSTGAHCGGARVKLVAIEQATQNIVASKKEKEFDVIIEKAKKTLKKIKISFPVNEPQHA